MARIIHKPDNHNCHRELAQLGKQPFGTVAECSCRKTYVVAEHQLDGFSWKERRMRATERLADPSYVMEDRDGNVMEDRDGNVH